MRKEEIEERSGMATAGLVLGIIGLCTCFIPLINNLSFILGVLAIIFAFIHFVKNKSRKKALIAIIIGVIAMVGTLNSQKTLSDELDTISGENTDKVLEELVDVEIGEFKVTEDEYITETELEVKVKNKSDEKKSFDIQIEAVDKNGDRIETDTIYINDLSAGQSQKEKAFQFVSSDIIDELENATFKVVEASAY